MNSFKPLFFEGLVHAFLDLLAFSPDADGEIEEGADVYRVEVAAVGALELGRDSSTERIVRWVTPAYPRSRLSAH